MTSEQEAEEWLDSPLSTEFTGRPIVQALLAELATLRATIEAARKLRNECEAIYAMSYDVIRDSAGYTNLAVFRQRIDELAVTMPPKEGK